MRLILQLLWDIACPQLGTSTLYNFLQAQAYRSTVVFTVTQLFQMTEQKKSQDVFFVG